MSRVSWVTLVALLIALPARAQSSGSVHGVVTDDSGAVLPGVAVSATSPDVGGSFTTTTDALGQYRLGDLPPGDYTIGAELSGFARLTRPVTVRAGLNVRADLRMSVGGIDETVVVTQEAPLLETRNGAQAVNVSGELLRGIPLLEGREWYGALSLAPGVTTAEWTNNEKLIYVHGADESANIVQIDGADVTSSTNGGVTYVNLNTDAIADIQVKTAGIDAASPLGIGGVISLATRSGTNQIKGAATLFLQPEAWNASNTPGGTSSTSKMRKVDLSLGAPIVKDHLWAFGAYRFTDQSTGISRSADQIAALEALVPGFVPFDNTNTAHFWFVKVTAQPSTDHRLSGFYQQDTNPTLSGLPDTEHPAKQATGGAAASFQIGSVWSDRLTTRARVSYNDKRRETKDTGIDGPLRRVFSSTILSGDLPVGNGSLADLGAPDVAFMTQPNQKFTASFDVTWLARRGARTHELRTGLYVQDRIEESRDTYINGGFFFEESAPREPGVLESGLVPFHRFVFDGTDLTVLRIHSRDYASYVQDSWRPTPRLTVNAGVRVDHITMRDELFETTTQESTEVGPRFGINYVLTGAATDVVRAHWVRVHDQPGIAAGVGTTSLGLRSLYDADLDGTFETVLVVPPTFAVTPDRRIDPDLHQPFVREWGAGYSKQIRGGLAARLDFVQRRYVDRPTLVETNGRYDGPRFVGYVDEAFNDLYTTTNNTWNTPVYSALEVSISKRSSRVQALASYVRQWRHLDGTWQPNDEASFIQPEAFANNRGIGGTSGASSPSQIRSLSGSNMTQRGTASGQWQDHTIRLGIACDGPWGLLLASSYTFQSGIWSGPVVSRVAAPDPAFGPSRVTLSNGRGVRNPLATTIRFASPTRGEGQLKTPALHAWNLRVGRRLVVGRAALDASLDIFNLTNNGADSSFRSGANQTYNPLFGTTEFRQLPRSAQIVLRASF